MISLRRRLTLAGVVASVGVLVVMAWVLFAAAEQTIRGDFDRDLQDDGRLLGGLVEFSDEGLELELEPVTQGFDRREVRTWWLVMTDDGERLAGHEPLREHRDAVDSYVTTTIDGRSARLTAMRLVPFVDDEHAHELPGPVPTLRLVVARDTSIVEARLGELRRVFWFFGALCALAVGVALAWQVRRGVEPIVRAGALLDSVGVGNLAPRVPLDDVPPELRAFVVRLNESLDRLASGIDREREFTQHAAHELRTPLTVLRAALELMLRRNEGGELLARRVNTSLETVAEMTTLVENLLLLARADDREASVPIESLLLRDEVDEAWQAFQGAAAERELSFSNAVGALVEIQADHVRLQIVLRNLVGNAVSYTARGGRIEARATAPNVIEIWDSGPQLAEEELARVFDRFWRGTRAGSAGSAHAGIGLSLVREVAVGCGWRIDVRNCPDGGLAFRVTLS